MRSILWNRDRRQEVPSRENGIVVGVDVSKNRIDFAGFRPEGRTADFQLAQDAEGFNRFKGILDEYQTLGYEVWVAYEPTGPYSLCLREWLSETQYRHVQVNPFHVKRTKETRDNSPRSTDSKSPSVIADLVWQGCYQNDVVLRGVYAELRNASVEWNSLSTKRTQTRNELQSLCQIWFPELLTFFTDRMCKSVQAIIRNYKSTKEIGDVSVDEIMSIVKAASLSRTGDEKATAIWASARVSVAVKEGLESLHEHMLWLLDMLNDVEDRQEKVKKRMEELLCKLPESECLLSISRVGTVTVGTFLGECGDLRRFGTYSCLEKFLGLNIYEVSSGEHKGEKHISKRGRSLARHILFLAALGQMRKDGLFHDYAKSRKKPRGKKDGDKLTVAVSRKLLKVFYALVRDQVMFDKDLFITARKAADDQSHRSRDAA